MAGVSRYLNSTIGAKTLMAVTGLGLVLFVIAHMAGNLQIYAGPDTMNRYAATLKGMPAVLWTLRLGLLAFFLAHVFMGLKLYFRNRAARPTRYEYQHTEEASFASRFMLQSGLVLLAFIVYHLLHFTFGVTNPAEYAGNLRPYQLDGKDVEDVYQMFILGFRNPAIAAAYIVAQIFLALHLYHGVASTFQSLGWMKRKYKRMVGRVGLAIAFVVTAGNIVMPLSVLLFNLGGDYLLSLPYRG